MILFKLGIFNIDLPLIFSFLLGVGIGLALFAMVYLIFVLSTMKSKKYIVSTKVKDVSDEEIKAMIKQTQDMFKDKKLRGENTMMGHCKELTADLVKNIAYKFFPDSKHPLLELSVDEILLLGVYISNRLDEVLDYRGLRMLRKFKVSTLVSLNETKQAIEDNPLIKATKKYKIASALKAAKSVINVVNPIYWARKAIVSTAMNVILKKLCVIIIGVSGEETYKIYSKSVFNKEVNIDTGVDDLVTDIKGEADNIEEPIEETGDR